ISFWMLVELMRDRQGTLSRKSENEACKDIEAHFANLGKVVPWLTVRRKFRDGKRLLGSPADREEAAALLDKLRALREQQGWDKDPLGLLGHTPEGIWRAFQADAEIAALRRRMADNEMKIRASINPQREALKEGYRLIAAARAKIRSEDQ